MRRPSTRSLFSTQQTPEISHKKTICISKTNIVHKKQSVISTRKMSNSSENKPTMGGLEKEETTKTRKTTKVQSDITGMKTTLSPTENVEGGNIRSGRKKAVSDLAMVTKTTDKEVLGSGRRRQSSTSDMITKFGYAPALGHYEDLKLGEAVRKHGDRRERIDSGLSDIIVKETIEEDQKEKENFELNEEGLTSEEAAKRLEQFGRNELEEKKDPKWLVFLKLLIQPMPIMIWIAAIIEVAIENYVDMAILLAILFINASISFYETNKAGNAIDVLKNSLKPSATVKRDGKFQEIDAALVVPGDTVLLAAGSAVPADCRVNEGEIDVDQAALTGESLPVTFYKYDSVKMGSNVVRGEVEATVEFTGGNTFFGKTASLLTETHEASHLQKMLMTVMMVLVVLSLTLCIINFIYLLVEGEPVKEALTFTVVLLVASIPLAIEIVTTTTLAIGSKTLVKSGAIVARLSAIEDLASMGILCSDKTGTLTLNKMVLQDDTPTYSSDGVVPQEMVLVYAALAAKWKEPPRDALDRLTLGSVNFGLLEPYEQIDFLPFDPTIKRTEGTIRDTRTGEEFKTSKGAPHIILGLLDESDAHVCEAVERDVARLGERGVRSLAVAKTDNNGTWRMVGLLTFLDPPRPDTKQTIADAHRYSVNVKMITGDHLLIAKNTADQLDLGPHIFGAENLPLLDEKTKAKPVDLSENYGDICLAADGFAQVYPEHKYLIVECLRELGFSIGMTGDGVNDAPALKRADVGIAVAGACDAACAAADIILTQEGLSTIIHGIEIAREIFARINNFMTYRVAATLQLLLFFFIAIFVFHPDQYDHPASAEEHSPWPHYFHVPVLMLMLITLLNDGTLISIAYDNARVSTHPTRWNLTVLFVSSSILGAVSCGSSLLLLHLLLDSWNPNGLFQKLGMSGLQYDQIVAAIYLQISVSCFLTLFTARTGTSFFWQIPPATILLVAAGFSLSLSSILSIIWPRATPDGIPTEGLEGEIGNFFFVWIYCLVFFFLQDMSKVVAYRWMYKTNFAGINTTGAVVLPESTKQLIKNWDAHSGLERVEEEDDEEAEGNEETPSTTTDESARDDNV